MSAAATKSVAESSIAGLLRDAALRLRTASDSPRLDAELLLAAILDANRAHLLAHGERALTATQALAFEASVVRRVSGEPIAYILGEKEFWSLALRVTPAVLVPRPETELLVEWALQCLQDLSAPALADLGTGSGAIALALAHERADARVVAIDRSEAALDVARANAAALQLAQVEFRLGDWLAPLGAERFDLLVSNPPYIEAGDSHLQALRHEPLQALTSGADGLDAIRHLVQHAPDHLQHGGWLLLEHGATQGAAVRDLLQSRGYDEVTTRRDLAGHERATAGRWMKA